MNSEHCSGRKPSYVPPFAVAGFCRTPPSLLGLDGKIGSANPAIIPAIPLAPFPKTVPYRRQSGSPFPVLASHTMKVVSTFHHPSAVSCSTRCKFPRRWRVPHGRKDESSRAPPPTTQRSAPRIYVGCMGSHRHDTISRVHGRSISRRTSRSA